ncbi:hypothetical protein BCR41DRAFT_221977 [Lobosporangium transversale]|uniref:Ion transport domain-containing protein n=1 Tax=Lobosporangium transversale TaxID=64571 RepID=A0A1Y2GVV7_9FUNG|nr:hypothetical protein BCR41DRAFT_221977 [Lobosporangium transversale]ORZ26395.1 hypothetical protein BCR41DRAFT_221977 [Lobosporangium transversale]|eukprot:XP_021884160.1 hypothetical protein BCR41DRAFT_221977 [Lobosporangium transversale]
MRFIWQCIYYLLILTTMFMQVYSPEPSLLLGLFAVISGFAVVFLLLELIQCLHDPQRYLTSPYNYVDLLAFTLPLVGSILQIVNIIQEDREGNTSLLSFSVLLICLHFLFELRVNERVCHFVTIVVQILGRIRVFFMFFAVGIFAFATAILHLYWACPYDNCEDLKEDVSFPKHFLHAFFSTYFFLVS